MSYPPVRFDGATGAVTAAFRPRETPPDQPGAWFRFTG